MSPGHLRLETEDKMGTLANVTHAIMIMENVTMSYKGIHPDLKNTSSTRKAIPMDERAKILAMHRESRATAGIYVAVVLAVYIILLTMLLCRYTKRQQRHSTSAESSHQSFLALFFNPLYPACDTLRRGWASLSCPCCSKTKKRTSTVDPETELPLHSLQSPGEAAGQGDNEIDLHPDNMPV